MRTIILLSGGIDSTVALAEAIKMGRECSVLCFDYGQKNRLERDCAANVAKHYGVELRNCQIDSAFWRGSSFLTGGSSNPLESYVPARNLLLIAHGVAAAEASDSEEVWFGANKDDHSFYPDCRPEFLEAMNVVAARGTKKSVRVIAPHMDRTKVEVIRRGIALGVPFELTTSCADIGQCGRCRGCVLARDAFAECGQ